MIYFLGLNIFYSGIEYTEKDWVLLKVSYLILSYLKYMALHVHRVGQSST